MHTTPQCLSTNGVITTEHNLSLARKEKPTIVIDDFWDMLSCLWLSEECSFVIEMLRIQFHWYELIAGYTGSRPGSILGTMNDDGTIDGFVRWRDCKLFLLPASPRPLPVLEITFHHTKNGHGRSNP